MRILVTVPDDSRREGFFPPEIRARLEALGKVTWNESTTEFTERELREQLPGIETLVTGWGTPRITTGMINAADGLETVAHTGGSVAPIVSEAVYDADITVISANDVMAAFTAEHTLGLILSALRSIPEADARMRAGEYELGDIAVETLYGTSVGFVGLGTIGERLLDHLARFDVTVHVFDPYVDPSEVADREFVELCELDTALDSEIVSIHASLTEETIGMLDADRLEQIPDGALLVNTARAAIIDEEAFMHELRSGRIDGAVDVFHEEPLPEDHEIRSLDNAILTPHIAGSRIYAPLTRSILTDLERIARDEPPEHEIPRSQWQRMTRFVDISDGHYECQNQ